jgi:hypothetical protein
MWQDEILDEIHRVREEHAKSFNYDLDAMFADWQRRQSPQFTVRLSSLLNPATNQARG